TRNVILGGVAGSINSTGSGNVYLGYAAGWSNTGSNNIFIGYYTGYGVLQNVSDKLVIDNSSTADPLIYGDFNNNTLKINGTMGISRLASTSYGLMVDGGSSSYYSMIVYKGAYAYGYGFNSASDIRLKRDVRKLENSLDIVNQLNGVTFRWTEESGSSTEHEHIGLIAQEVEKLLPQLVVENAEGYKGIAYDKITAVLIEAVKEQQQEIEALKKENESYRGLADELKLIEQRLLELEAK
ncbi:MAG: tail fiber domain-containing protein, partial [Bacteroidales bacterium]